MPLKEPSWWYREPAGLVPTLLHPLALLVGHIGERRFLNASPYRSTLRVVCVGNLTAGGAGKTPVAREIARQLMADGKRPAFLSRGYGGRIKGPHLVDFAVDQAADVGDEPLLLARSGPAMVSARRDDGARAIEQLGVADTIVMDDGFQNPQLTKDLSIVVIDQARLIGNGQVMPAGPLRLKLQSQLARADAFVLLGTGWPERQIPDFLVGTRKPVLTAMIVQEPGQDAILSGPLLAYAGIGRPEKFFETLRGLGAELAGTISFPDHYPYGEDDAKTLLNRAHAANAQLITTEKDLVRLTGKSALRNLAEQTTALRIGLAFANDGLERLSELLKR